MWRALEEPRHGWYHAVVLLVGIALLPGCTKMSDSNQAEGETCAGLRSWGTTIAQLLEMGVHMEEYKSTGDVLEKWGDSGLIEKNERLRMERDYWGRPFEMHVNRTNDGIVARVSSAGGNGIWENGLGDDLYVEVRQGGRPPSIDIRLRCMGVVRSVEGRY
jgi:hypothetical protein